MLTEKKRTFALLVFAKQRLVDAYREAYDAERMAPQTVRVKASNLRRDPDVVAYLAELHEAQQTEIVATRGYVEAALIDVAERALGRRAGPATRGDQGELFQAPAGSETDLKTAVKALGLLGADLGMFSTNAGAGDGPQPIEEQSDQQLTFIANADGSFVPEGGDGGSGAAGEGGGDGGGARGAGPARGGADQP